MNIIFQFRLRLHLWKCSYGFEDGHPWRWIAGRLGLEDCFKGVNGSGARSANIVEDTGWGRMFDLMDEVCNEH